MHTRSAIRTKLLCLSVIWIASMQHAEACERLVRQQFGAAEITLARSVEPGAFAVPPDTRNASQTNAALANLPAFCRIEAIARPSDDSQIGIEVWLPESGWNGLLLAVGNGGWAGSISYAALAEALADGYAATSTDTGHIGNSVDFAIGHPEKLLDFAHRAVHEMALLGKAVVEAHYSRPAEQAYFAGCSTGGRQAFAAAQRYPNDFDGLVAGAPAYYPTHLQGMQVWTASINANQADAPLRQEEFDLLNAATVAACDTLDGVTDAVIEDPRACAYDPVSLVCSGDKTATCLTAQQAETARRIYRGPVDKTGQVIFPGLAVGSEAGWRMVGDDTPLLLANDMYARLVFNDPQWDFRTFDAPRDIAIAIDRIGDVLDSADPDISAFVARGGKLLIYHGWSDPGVPAAGTIRYYEEATTAAGSTSAAQSVRLFMVPGMGHCRGGPGTDTFDPVSALDLWVREGLIPERIEAEKRVDGEVIRTRPLCAYPKRAVYSGDGSTDDSRNFACL